MKSETLKPIATASALALVVLFSNEAVLTDACAAPSFAAARKFDLNSSARSIATADFDGDSRLDLAVSTFDGVSILSGSGNGNFQVGATFGSRAGSIAIGDFDSDGKPDLVVGTSDGVSVFVGNGNGTFQTTSNQNAGQYIRSVGVGDFNGDGHPDIAVAYVNGVSVLMGNGDGTFQTGANYSTGLAPFSVVVSDFDGDGGLDLAVADPGGLFSVPPFDRGIAVLSGNGDGTFQTAVHYRTDVRPGSLAVADFNDDGQPDLAAAADMHGIVVMLGNGDGTFQDPISHLARVLWPYTLVAGDLNGDGHADVATVDEHGVVVLTGRSDGTFRRAVRYGAGSHPQSLVVGDFNGDGMADLVTADSGSSISVLLGNQDGDLQGVVNFWVGQDPRYVVASDFNGDSNADLAVAGSDTVSVLLSDGDGSFQIPARHGVGNSPVSLAVADFNRDGMLDVATANVRSDDISLLLGQSDGTFQGATAINVVMPDPAMGYSQSVGVGDFNGDGKPDLVLAKADYYKSVYVLRGGGDGTFSSFVRQALGYYPKDVVVADFNGDGRLDLAVVHEDPVAYEDGVSVLLGWGNLTFRPAVRYAAGQRPQAIRVGDFNGDGRPDLAVANSGRYDRGDSSYTNSSVTILLGTGTGTFQAAVNYTAGMNPQSLAVGDFNSDGKPDLAVANLGSPSIMTYAAPPGLPKPTRAVFGSVSVLSGNGDGTFQDALNYGAAYHPASVAVGDFNSDGKPDLAVAGFYYDDVSVLLNTCPYAGTGNGNSVPELS